MEQLLFGVILVLVAIPGAVLTAILLIGMVRYAGEQHPWMLVVGPVLLVTLAVALALRQRRSGADTSRHPGITMHRIPVAGGIGLVFVVGYVFMFWHGAPEYRPLVVLLPILGAIVAGVLIWRNGRRPAGGRDSTDAAEGQEQPECAADDALRKDGP